MVRRFRCLAVKAKWREHGGWRMTRGRMATYKAKKAWLSCCKGRMGEGGVNQR